MLYFSSNENTSWKWTVLHTGSHESLLFELLWITYYCINNKILSSIRLKWGTVSFHYVTELVPQTTNRIYYLLQTDWKWSLEIAPPLRQKQNKGLDFRDQNQPTTKVSVVQFTYQDLKTGSPFNLCTLRQFQLLRHLFSSACASHGLSIIQ